MNAHPRFLVRALRANAMFSGISGAALLVLPGDWARLFGVLDAPVYAVLGVGLLAFAALVAWVSADPVPRRPVVRLVLGADLLWVTATPFVMVLGAAAIRAPAQLLLLAVALAVSVLAALQWRGLRAVRYSASGTCGPASRGSRPSRRGSGTHSTRVS